MKADLSRAGLLIYLASFSPIQAAEFMGLGHLDGGGYRWSGSRAYDVSADGSVVVGQSNSDMDFPSLTVSGEPFRWTVAGGMESLGSISGGAFEGGANAVSADGSVIVGYDYSDPRYHAFRWTARDGRQILRLPPDSPYESQSAYSVSADGGVIVGNSFIPYFDDEYAAFRWTAQTGTARIPHTGGTSAGAVSADGEVVVGQIYPISLRYAAAWTEEGDWNQLRLKDPVMAWIVDDGWTLLEAGASLTESLASAASADGNVIVGIYDYTSVYPTALRWTASGDLDFLTDPDSDVFSHANDVSADGRVVVGTLGARLLDSGAEDHAYLWDEANGVRLVADVLSAEGMDLTEWELYTAKAVSADGTFIVGSGINPHGINEAWIANLGSEPVITPVPDIKINGADGPLTLTKGDQILLSLHLDTNGRSEPADWWLIGFSPYGTLYWTPRTSWTYQRLPAYQGRLRDLQDFRLPVISAEELAPGPYRLVFGVDLKMDGVIRRTRPPYAYSDYIDVMIVH